MYLFKKKERSLEGLHRKAERGDRNAQYDLAEHYLAGDAVTKNEKKAKRLFKRAAQQAHLLAQSRLAYCYDNAKGCKRNLSKALHWTKQAALAGEPSAQARYGYYYEQHVVGARSSRDVRDDLAQARYNYYYEQHGVGARSSRDVREAVMWYQRSAEQGFAEAQVWMGKHYEKINSCDIAQATEWYRKAAAQDHASAQQALTRCLEKLKNQEQNRVSGVQRQGQAAPNTSCLPLPGLLSAPKPSAQVSSAPDAGSFIYPRSRPPTSYRRTQTPGHAEYREAERLMLNAQYKQALPFFEKAASVDYPPAYAMLYSLYDKGGKIGARDIGKENYYLEKFTAHFPWFQKAAVSGHAVAQNQLAYFYFYGIGVTKNAIEARQLIHKSAIQGYVTAQQNMGNFYKDGAGGAKNAALALEWYRKAVGQGSVDAQNDIGDFYLNGVGVAMNESLAFLSYQRAAEKGQSKGQYMVGVCYEVGCGVVKNEAEAVRWFRQSAAQGYADAQQILEWISTSDDSARESAEKNNAIRQKVIGKNFEEGTGITQNLRMAAHWYRQSAEQGQSGGQYNLARCYENGIGVPQNITQAITWYRTASMNNNAKAAERLAFCERQQLQQEQTREVETLRRQQEAERQRLIAAEKIRQEQVRKAELLRREQEEKRQQQLADERLRQEKTRAAEAERELSAQRLHKNNQEKLESEERKRIHTEKIRQAAIKNPPTAWYRNEDYERAERLYLKVRYKEAVLALEKAAKSGYPPAYVLFEIIYFDRQISGEYNRQTLLEYSMKVKENLLWFQIYAAVGNTIAQFYLGYLTSKSEQQHWYRKAADNGHFMAQFMLGDQIKYSAGREEGLKLLDKSAKQGYVHAKYSLAYYRYQNAENVDDCRSAKKVFQELVLQGHKDSATRLAYCDSRIRSQYMLDCQRRSLARECEEKERERARRKQQQEQEQYEKKIANLTSASYTIYENCLADSYNKSYEETLSPEDKKLFRQIVERQTAEQKAKKEAISLAEDVAEDERWHRELHKPYHASQNYQPERREALTERRELSSEWRTLQQHPTVYNSDRREQLEQQGYGQHGSRHEGESCIIS